MKLQRSKMVAISVLVACMPSLVFPAPSDRCLDFSQNNAERSQKSSLQNRMRQGVKELLQKSKKWANDKEIRRNVLHGALCVLAIVGAYYVGKRGEIFQNSGHILKEQGNAIQFRVEQQCDGYSCGYRAVRNGISIVHALQKKEGDMQDNIANAFVNGTKMQDSIGTATLQVNDAKNRVPGLKGNKQLAADELLVLWKGYAEQNKTLPMCIVYNEQHIRANGIGLYAAEDVSGRIVEFKNSPDQLLPVIINTVGHWVVDILYRKNDGSFMHIIADSVNTNHLSPWRSTSVRGFIAAERSTTIEGRNK